MTEVLTVSPVGIIRKRDTSIVIEIDEAYELAMQGLELFSHISVYYWFDKNDNLNGRTVLRVHPCRNKQNPLTGVFATHSPLRPNLIGASLCRILSIDKTRITIDDIDAFDGSPVIDIKCYFPPSLSRAEIKVPDWERN